MIDLNDPFWRLLFGLGIILAFDAYLAFFGKVDKSRQASLIHSFFQFTKSSFYNTFPNLFYQINNKVDVMN